MVRYTNTVFMVFKKGKYMELREDWSIIILFDLFIELNMLWLLYVVEWNQYFYLKEKIAISSSSNYILYLEAVLIRSQLIHILPDKHLVCLICWCICWLPCGILILFDQYYWSIIYFIIHGHEIKYIISYDCPKIWSR